MAKIRIAGIRMVRIIGAKYKKNKLPDGTYSACYKCKTCGQELGYVDACKTSREAASLAMDNLDPFRRHYCHICGRRLTRMLISIPDLQSWFAEKVKGAKLHK